MTVISSVYKDDDDVKCHTSRADPLRERPGSFCFTLCGISHFPSNMVLFFLLLQRDLRLFFVYTAVYFYRFQSPPFYPICMLRRRLVVANRRITIYLYLYTTITKHFVSWTREMESRHDTVGITLKRITLCFPFGPLEHCLALTCTFSHW